MGGSYNSTSYEIDAIIKNQRKDQMVPSTTQKKPRKTEYK